jgi:hypothetical protein
MKKLFLMLFLFISLSAAVQIQIRRATDANWASENPTLAEGEFGYETNTGNLKIGDGVTAWNSLSYFVGGSDDDIDSVRYRNNYLIVFEDETKDSALINCSASNADSVGNALAFTAENFYDCKLVRHDYFTIPPHSCSQGIAYYGDYIYTSTHVDSAGNYRKAIYKWTRYGTKVDSFIRDNYPSTGAILEFADINVIFGKLYVCMNNCGHGDSNKIMIFDLDLNPLDSTPWLTHQVVLEGVDWNDGYYWTCDNSEDYVSRYDKNWNYIDSIVVTSLSPYGYNGMSWSGKSLFINMHENMTPYAVSEYNYDKSSNSLSKIKQHERPSAQAGQGIDFVDKNTIVFAVRSSSSTIRDTVLFCRFEPIYTFQATIFNPDEIYTIQDTIPIFAVESGFAQNGITIDSIGIKTDKSSTYCVHFWEYTSPTDEAPRYIVGLTTSSSYEEKVKVTNDPIIDAGSIIYMDIPDTDIDILQVWGTYTRN